MSKVLLLANSKDPVFRSVLNIKYDESVGKVLDELRLPKRLTSMSKVPSGTSGGKTMTGDDAVLLRLSQVKVALGEKNSTIALIDRGSEGVEPMTYLIGKKATDLSHIALKIAQSYSAAK